MSDLKEYSQSVTSKEGLMDKMSIDSDEEDNDGEDWEEELESEETISINCLFQSKKCDSTFNSIEKGIIHLKHDHKLDFLELKLVYQMDCYSIIKLINYIRKHDKSVEDILQCFNSSNGDINNKVILKSLPWSSDEYMKPYLNDDPWLMYDYDDIEESLEDNTPLRSIHHVNVEHGRITMTQEHYTSLQEQIKQLKQQFEQKNAELEMKNEVIMQMRSVMENMMLKQCDDHLENGSKEQNGNNSRRHDNYYFNSYENADIHAEMIKDTVRTESYKAAIMNNVSLFENKHVLDVGAGTGILSIFAAQAGAKQVYAVEKSDIAYETIEIIRTNKLNNKIEVYHKLLEDIELPTEKVDIIISEWMGYFLLFETMIDSVINARDRFLKPDGVVCPNRFSLHLCGAADEGLYKSLISFWDNVHDVDMSVMTRLVFSDAQILFVNKNSICTTTEQLTSIDLNSRSTTISCVNFESDFNLRSTEDCILNCLVGYFNTYFDLPNPIEFSTSPTSKSTHWKQTLFLLKTPIQLKEGEHLTGSLKCERMESDTRSLNVTITVRGTTHVYQLH